VKLRRPKARYLEACVWDFVPYEGQIVIFLTYLNIPLCLILEKQDRSGHCFQRIMKLYYRILSDSSLFNELVH